MHVIDGNRNRTVWSNLYQYRWFWQHRLREQVKTKVADVGAPFCIDHHVVAMKSGKCTQVRHFNEPSRIKSHQLSIDHRNDEQSPIRQPAESRRLVRHFDHDMRTTIAINAHHLMREKIREPKFAVVPTWGLGESKVFDQAGVIGHGGFFCSSVGWAPRAQVVDRRMRTAWARGAHPTTAKDYFAASPSRSISTLSFA